MNNSANAIAIIGATVNVPGATNLDEFWELLREQREVMIDLKPQGEEATHLVWRRPILEGLDLFDPSYFGISDGDALNMDPQHRLFLMACRSLLYSSGFNHRSNPSVGVYAGCDESQYERNVNPMDKDSAIATFTRYVSTDRDFLASRVSYCLDLHGPSMTVQTACSTSLVSVHLACRALLGGECDAAIAGGVALQLPQGKPYEYQPEMVYSRDGSCRPFEARSDGTNLSSGLGVVLLRRYEDAVRDNERILAIIEGSAVNNDGRRKMSITAPSAAGQAEALRRAIGGARLNVDELRFVEAHGTATKLGDPIEFKALSEVLREHTDRRAFCAITAVKANLGHLGYAAGVVSLIKAALFINKGIVPGMTNYESPSPYIKLEHSPLFISPEHSMEGFESGAALVTSLGAGGTNASIVLRRAPNYAPDLEETDLPALLMFSEDKPTYAERNAVDTLRKIQAGQLLPAHAAGLLGRSSSHGAYRSVLVANSEGRSSVIEKEVRAPKRVPRICFVIPGQGSQKQGAYKALYNTHQGFRRHFDECALQFKAHLGFHVGDALWWDVTRYADVFDDTDIAQPVIFTIQYALVGALRDSGIQPSVVVGHSFGEFLCLWLSGQISLEDTVKLIVDRARHLKNVPDGRMLVVSGINVEQMIEWLEDGVHISAINSPSQIVVSGAPHAIHAMEEKLKAQRFELRILSQRGPFHSPLVGEALTRFSKGRSPLQANAPRISMYSTVTGERVVSSGVGDLVEYFAHHGVKPVQFSRALNGAAEDADFVLEIGDTFISNWILSQGLPAYPLIERNELGEHANFSLAIGRCWMNGVQVNVGTSRPAPPAAWLPNFAFNCQPYWPVGNSTNMGAGDIRRVSGEGDGEAVAVTLETVQQLFAAYLKTAKVLPDDDFFDLGGHSLLAFSLCRHVQIEYKLSVTVQALFAARTPRKFTAYLVSLH